MKHFLLGCGVGIVISVALAVCVVLIAITFFQDYFIEKKTEHLKRPPMPMDAPVEYGWTIKTLEGETLSMETFKGKTVFTVFWSPDCFSCLAELGGIQRLYDKTRDLGVEFACMSVGEDEEELRTVLEEREFTVPVYVTTKDRPEMFKSGEHPERLHFLGRRNAGLRACWRAQLG